ncbi:MAG: tetratricopeptide repeat protein [Hyphomicrobiaceae bacterium]
MIDHPSRKSAVVRRLPGLVAALATALTLGACAQGGVGADPFNLAGSEDIRPLQDFSDPVTAVDYYSKLYASDPTNKTIAMNYAQSLSDSGHSSRALAVYRTAASHHSKDRDFAAAYGRAALSAGKLALADKLLAHADNPGDPDWRVVSARGTALAKQGKYEQAQPYFERALQLAPGNSTVLSNLAMARAANGDLKSAENLLRKATLMPNARPQVRQNLNLVLQLQGRNAESAATGSSAPLQLRRAVEPAQSQDAFRQANAAKASTTQ